jgi:tryptophan-rich sensory protein
VEAKPWIALIVFFFITLGVGSVASYLTARGVREWYPRLHKPRGTPPAWVFGPVWTTLYVLMAVAAWMIWKQYGWSGGRSALILFFGQLALNAAWSGLFFGARLPGVAFAEMVILWLAIAFNMLVFYWLLPMAAFLLLPYLIWVSYASYLNFGLWRLNRAAA